jgi:superfamily II DNA or RNA helicase
VRELQELGVLVPCVTYRPETRTKALAREPVEAYREAGWGERCFVFAVNVAHAEMLAGTFRDAGSPAATIHADTPWALRRARLDAFRSQDPGALRKIGSPEDAPLVLVNVYALTEGVDVPEASVCITAKGIGHGGMMRQMIGRVLRCAEGKSRAIWWDLRGQSHIKKIGLPEADCTYSLDGKAITVTEDKDDPPKRCKACQAVFMTWKIDRTSGARSCPQCGEGAPAIEVPEVVDRECFAVGSGASEKDQADAVERLAMTAADRGYRSGWVSVRYSEQFGKLPPRGSVDAAMLRARKALGIRVTEGEIEAERERLYKIAHEKNIPLSWVEKKIAEKYGPQAA